MFKQKLKYLIIPTLLVFTAASFVWFFVNHPEYWEKLKSVSPWVIGIVVVLNIPMLLILTFLSDMTIKLCGRSINKRENFILTAYSTLVNFFGPLQSGPGVRAAYLKARHRVRIKDYTLASLLLLAIFAIINLLFLLIGTRPWGQVTLLLVVLGLFGYLIFGYIEKRDTNINESKFRLNSKLLAGIIIGTFVQVSLMVVWYYIELKSVDQGVHFSQAVSYTGAANFSLFVSITPAGAGFREAFLILSKNIHHVSTGDIASANLIDRVSYVIFLGLLFLLVLSMHAKQKIVKMKRLSVTNADKE